MGKGLERLKPEDILALIKDERIVIRTAPPWKGNAPAMAEGTKRGLGLSIAISKATSGVLGTVVDPETGRLITRKALAQKELAKKLRSS